MHFNHNLVKNNDGILKTLVFRSVLLGSVSHETFMMYVGSQQGGEGGLMRLQSRGTTALCRGKAAVHSPRNSQLIPSKQLGFFSGLFIGILAGLSAAAVLFLWWVLEQ